MLLNTAILSKNPWGSTFFATLIEKSMRKDLFTICTNTASQKSARITEHTKFFLQKKSQNAIIKKYMRYF